MSQVCFPSLRRAARIGLASCLLASCAAERQASDFRGGGPSGAGASPAGSGWFGGSRQTSPSRFGWGAGSAAPQGADPRDGATAMAQRAAADRERIRAERAAAQVAEQSEWLRIAEFNRRFKEEQKAAKRAGRQGVVPAPMTTPTSAATHPRGHEVPAAAAPQRQRGILSRISLGGGGGNAGGLGGGFGGGFPKRVQAPQHQIFVDHSQIDALGPDNSRVEISLGEQRARVYRRSGVQKTLVIDTPVSTGKSGFETPTGSFKISEKLVGKQSTLYGIWYDADGQQVPSSGESGKRPPGGVRFEGAEMPYWMRLVDGIGMHIGEVPGYPASHGCIRVPDSIQPLIFSKVAVGTTVEVTR